MSGSDPERATRVVADADVLAADLLVGGTAREALDAVRAHSWLTLVASDALLDDAAAVVERLADPSLAGDWRAAAAALSERVDHPAGDHPALACAYRRDVAHVLTFDDELTGARANAALQGRMQVSVTTPDAFVRLFDPAAVHEATGRGPYGGPDRDPRA